MKKIIFGLVFVLFSFFVSAQSQSTKHMYENFGTWKLKVDQNELSISAFVTVQEKNEEMDRYELKLEMQSKNRKQQKEIEENRTTYKYEVYLKSNSIFKGDTVSTWIYGAKVFIDGFEITKEKFPEGFMMLIEKKPTLIYWYETASPEKLNFNVEWESAVYENRSNN